MRPTHLYVDDASPTLGMVSAFCGWRVALRHTTGDWSRVTCNLCIGRRDGALQQIYNQDREHKVRET